MSTSKVVEIISRSDAQTRALGHKIARSITITRVVALLGPLGSGKTRLVKGMAQGLGLRNPDKVTSPSFTLIQEYPTSPPLYHIDAYRLQSANDLIRLGVLELFEGPGISVIEWAERARGILPRSRIQVEFEHLGKNSRRIRVREVGPDTGFMHWFEGFLRKSHHAFTAGVDRRARERIEYQKGLGRQNARSDRKSGRPD